jgi:hypothetical protein
MDFAELGFNNGKAILGFLGFIVFCNTTYMTKELEERSKIPFHFNAFQLHNIQARPNSIPQISLPILLQYIAMRSQNSQDSPLLPGPKQLLRMECNAQSFLIDQTHLCIYLPFLFSASVFLNGNPLVLLSAPVFLLILPSLLANKMHQNATAARKVEPSVPRLKDMTPVSVHMV